MKKSIIKISAFVGLSSLLVACGGGGGGGNAQSHDTHHNQPLNPPATSQAPTQQPSQTQDKESEQIASKDHTSDNGKMDAKTPEGSVPTVTEDKQKDSAGTQATTPSSEHVNASPKPAQPQAESEAQSQTEPSVQPPQQAPSQPPSATVTPKVEQHTQTESAQQAEQADRVQQAEQPIQQAQEANTSNQATASKERNKREVNAIGKVGSNTWGGQCVSQEYCSINITSPLTVDTYDVKTTDISKRGLSSSESTSETAKTLTLTSQNSKGENYDFVLLGSEDAPMAYYGYRERANNAHTGKHYDFLYSSKDEVTYHELPEHFSATYSKDGGFIYSPLSQSSLSNNTQRRKGDVYIDYKDGAVTGSIYNGDTQYDRTHALFKITGNGENLIVESTEYIVGSGSTIDPNQKGVITARFIDSKQGAGDYKYLLGAGKSDEVANKTGWVGVIFAERKDK